MMQNHYGTWGLVRGACACIVCNGRWRGACVLSSCSKEREQTLEKEERKKKEGQNIMNVVIVVYTYP